MNNNDVFKKLRVALQLRDDQIIEILNLVNFRVSKGELGNVFRNEEHPNYMECGDQLLRNFLNGLVIFLRGTKENPKQPLEVLEQIKKEKLPLGEQYKKEAAQNTENVKKEFKKSFPNNGSTKKPFSNKDSKPENPVERFKYNSGKNKK